MAGGYWRIGKDNTEIIELTTPFGNFNGYKLKKPATSTITKEILLDFNDKIILHDFNNPDQVAIDIGNNFIGFIPFREYTSQFLIADTGIDNGVDRIYSIIALENNDVFLAFVTNLPI